MTPVTCVTCSACPNRRRLTLNSPSGTGSTPSAARAAVDHRVGVEAAGDGDVRAELDVAETALHDVDLEPVGAAIARGRPQGLRDRGVLGFAPPCSIRTVTVTVGTPCAMPQAAVASATPGSASASASKSLSPTSRPRLCTRPGAAARATSGASGSDAAGDRRRAAAPPAAGRAGPAGPSVARLERAVRAGARTGRGAHVVDAAGQPRAERSAVAELHPRVAVAVLADDVDLGVRALPEQRLHARPRAARDAHLEPRRLRWRLRRRLVVGERRLRQLERLEGAAAVAAADRRLGLGLALVGVDDVAEHDRRGVVGRLREPGVRHRGGERDLVQPFEAGHARVVDRDGRDDRRDRIGGGRRQQDPAPGERSRDVGVALEVEVVAAVASARSPGGA